MGKIHNLYTTVCCDIISETDLAFLIKHKHQKIWVPKSQLEEMPDRSDGTIGIDLRVSMWIAEREGLI